MMLDTRLHVDRSEKKFTIERRQDVEAIIENNKRLQSIEQKSDWGRHIASVPNIFLEQWLNEEWARGNKEMRLFSEDFNKMVALKLQSNEWKFLRVDK